MGEKNLNFLFWMHMDPKPISNDQVGSGSGPCAHTKFLDVFKLQILLSNFEFLSTIVRAQLYLYGFLSLLDLSMNAVLKNVWEKKTFEK